jgi:lipoprotein NlpI
VKAFSRILILALLVLAGDLSSAAEIGPAAPTAREWNTRGIERSRKGEAQQAVDAFSQAILLAPKLADAYVNRAIVYIGLKEWKKAEADCTTAIGLDPDNTRSYHQRAIIRSQMGLPDAAFAAASRAARMDPTNPSVVFTRYLTCSRSGRHELGHFAGETYIGLQSWSDIWSPYMALLNNISLRRAGYEEESRAILSEATKWLNAEQWPVPIVIYLKEDLDAEQLLALANDNDQKTLAHYYIGANEWLNGQANSARTHFEWVSANGNKDFLQHLLAEDHLKELDRAGADGQ